MSHNCGSTCKRKQSPRIPCTACNRAATLNPRRHADAKEIAAAVDMG